MPAWLRANIGALREQSDEIILLHLLSKTLSGLGLGLLLGMALGDRSAAWGGALLGVGVATGIRSGHCILRTRARRKAETGARDDD